MLAGNCLQESSDRLLREVSTEVPFILDLSEQFTFLGPSCLPVLGLAVEDLLGRNIYEFIHPGDADECCDTWQTLRFNPDISMSVQCRVRRADGTWRILDITRKGVRGETGGSACYVGIMQDITERREAEAKLRSAQMLLQAMSLASEVLVSGTDFDASIRQCLQIVGLVLGIDRVTIFQNHPHPETGEPARSLRYEWCGIGVPGTRPEDRKNYPWDPEHSYPRELLEKGHVLAAVVRDLPPLDIPFHERNSRKSFLIVPIFVGLDWWGTISYSDVTEERVRSESEVASLQTLAHSIGSFIARHEANMALIEARDRAIEASGAKSQFLANMSHEIRTPLNGVIGMTSLLLERSLDADSQEIVSAIRSSGETLLRVINDILDFSKIEAGKLDIEVTPVTVGALVADVVSLYGSHAKAKGIVLFQAGPEEAPPFVMADPVRLKQILSNLVSNSIKFTHQGSVAIRWSWTACDDSIALRFVVADTGIGIPADRLGAIFERFTQAESGTHRKYGGTGLGLAICTRLVELMGGHIFVRSELGKGTEFQVDLRFCRAAEQEGEVLTSEPCGDETVRPGLRILLAEDNTINVMVALRLLKQFQCHVDVAEDGVAAVAAAKAASYDLILMDVEMPICDGIEATRLIREQEAADGPRRVIVALTANALEEDRRVCAEAGMDGFIAKPVTLASLRLALLQWAGRNV
jgi:PAS domain S-box-containing protein